MGLRPFQFTGARAVVTGAASGIGEQLAIELARRGADLVLVDRDADRLHRLVEQLHVTSPGTESHPVVADLADADELERVAEAADQQWPALDLLVNNAGVAMAGMFADLTAEEFDWVLRINLHAPIALCRALLPALRRAEGAHIVNVSSLFGLLAPPGNSPYVTSKFGLRGFTEALHAELAPVGIGVTACIQVACGRGSPRRLGSEPSSPRRRLSRARPGSPGCCATHRTRPPPDPRRGRASQGARADRRVGACARPLDPGVAGGVPGAHAPNAFRAGAGRRVSTAAASELAHVRWIGGGSGGGKSTVARRLADRFELLVYDTDVAMADHAARATRDDAPSLAAFLAMDMDERWLDRDPQVMLETFHWFRGKGSTRPRGSA